MKVQIQTKTVFKKKKIAITSPDFSEETYFWENGISHVIGIDEVGRGCFAGPVVVAGVVFGSKSTFDWFSQIHDSKLLSASLRELLSPLIQKNCLHFSIVEIPVSVINDVGIGTASFLGMQEVVKKLSEKIVHTNIAVLVDAFTIPEINFVQKPIIKGDQKSISIAAASIIAKVYRDAVMDKLSIQYKEYGFERNKGYGTKEHREAIKKYGLSSIHRLSFDLQKYI